ncbi:hypothetical protein M2152_002780 [Microbacteriaceae bacterium SG_E_30_P1]|uniref:Polyketide cyclase / dehydrase and lipid transport n=1 Tax=Antiquaquibacter oligotrophicus TaxID=2880260 RepID=A0ABT6KRI9_9MICO|nr:SRPBCC family protein [Antiquaquibacter oligotrophicus]MDH6182598.1 hypothetical protein [Antiquaquibacter oligotrophicus]UDF14437.1 SRPBCC family protein [Antiquaquibacter oligotrophicus]
MSVTVREMACSPDDVFAVLADGWVFPTWVVGASRMRDVDESWPEVGSQLHHSFGLWPAVIDDRTTVLEWDPPHKMAMKPAGWPLGEALVIIEVKPRGDGCVVRMTEEVLRGPARLVPRPVTESLLRVRNRETLLRLAFAAEGGKAKRDREAG